MSPEPNSNEAAEALIGACIAEGFDTRRRIVGAGLVDEHQPRRIEIELAVEPRLARAQNVGTVLFGRVPDLFYA